MDDLALARVLHVIGVVHWLGGLAFVTLVVLPLARRQGAAGVALFDAVERKFSRQVRVSVPLVGASGFWMTWRMDLWERFADPTFWWMDAMLGLWILFMALLFIVEPLAERRIADMARREPVAMLNQLGRAHAVLLAAATVSLLGTVGAVHGLF